jgi:hypothetical protein
MTVRVRKGTAVISFAIDMLRTPYFFADRDKTVTVNGRTHKILHVVRPHLRIGPDGRRHIVRMHFRGLRKFKWNGYSVSIGIAGWHGVAFSDFGIDPVDEEKAAKLREEGHTLLSAAGATAMIEKHQV